jgi:hypothetical protein
MRSAAGSAGSSMRLDRRTVFFAPRDAPLDGLQRHPDSADVLFAVQVQTPYRLAQFCVLHGQAVMPGVIGDAKPAILF